MPTLIPNDPQKERSLPTPPRQPKLGQEQASASNACPCLTKRDYKTVPSIQELRTYSDVELSCVKDFTVCHDQYGSVIWPGETNIANVNLDEHVIFEENAIEVYPDDENKPPMGQQLNKLAAIELRGCWPRDKKTQQRRPTDNTKRLAKYEKRLEALCDNTEGMRFLKYERNTGTWRFEVEHFTKYGLDDMSDDDIDTPVTDPTQAKPPSQAKRPE